MQEVAALIILLVVSLPSYVTVHVSYAASVLQDAALLVGVAGLCLAQPRGCAGA